MQSGGGSLESSAACAKIRQSRRTRSISRKSQPTLGRCLWRRNVARIACCCGWKTPNIRADGRDHERVAKATQGSTTEFGQRTFQAHRPWRNSERMLDELATARGDTHGSVDGDASSVRIMTTRNSKGLEAECVFVIGLEEGAFPADERGSPQFEEDARLFFVSMNLSKERIVFISCSGPIGWKHLPIGLL